jgi:hypothetical protein
MSAQRPSPPGPAPGPPLPAGQRVRLRSGRVLASEWNEDDLVAFCAADIGSRAPGCTLPPLRLFRVDGAEGCDLRVFLEFDERGGGSPGALARALPAAALVDAHRGVSVWRAARERCAAGDFSPVECEQADAHCAAPEQVRAVLDFLGACPPDGSGADALAAAAARRLDALVCGARAALPLPDHVVAALLSAPCARAALGAVAARVHPRAAARAAAARHWIACCAILWSGAPVEGAREIVMGAAANGSAPTVVAVLARGLYKQADYADQYGMLSELMEHTRDPAEALELLDALARAIQDQGRNMVVALARTPEQLDLVLGRYEAGAGWRPEYLRVDHFDGRMAAMALRVFPHLVWRAIREGGARGSDIRHAYVLPHLVFLADDEQSCIEQLASCDRKLVAESVSCHDREANAFVALCHARRLARKTRVAQALLGACPQDAVMADAAGLLVEAAISLDAGLVGVLLVAVPSAAYHAQRVIAAVRARDAAAAAEMERMVAQTIWDLEGQ